VARIPQPGESLILGDGRRFILHHADEDIRGWWFKATVQDGSSMVEGNLRLEWDTAARAWRPCRASSASPHPVTTERRRQPRSMHAD